VIRIDISVIRDMSELRAEGYRKSFYLLFKVKKQKTVEHAVTLEALWTTYHAFTFCSCN